MILGQKLLNTPTQLPVPWLPDGRLGLRNIKRIQITCNLKETNNFLLLCFSINNAYSLLIRTELLTEFRGTTGEMGLQNWSLSINSWLQKGPDTMVEILQQLAVGRKTTAWYNVFTSFGKLRRQLFLPCMYIISYDKGKDWMGAKLLAE